MNLFIFTRNEKLPSTNTPEPVTEEDEEEEEEAEKVTVKKEEKAASPSSPQLQSPPTAKSPSIHTKGILK